MAENEFSKKVRELRAKHGMTLEQVADLVGVGKSTVRKWETGMIENIRRDKIAKLAEALHTTPGYLMGWKEDEPAISPAKAEITGIISDMTDDQLKEVLRYIKFIKQGE